MIKAGTKWVYGDNVIEWTKDVHVGDPLTTEIVIINGRKPSVGEEMPEWAVRRVHNGLPWWASEKPPAHVTVTEPEGEE